jgi:DNA-directed RNA polymerase subunit F
VVASMAKRILSEKAISLEEVKELLKQRDEEAPLNYIQRVTLDFANRFSKDFPKQTEFIQKMAEEFDIKKDKAIQLINIVPESVKDVDIILGRDYSKETKTNVFERIKEHLAMYADFVEEEDAEEDLDEF